MAQEDDELKVRSKPPLSEIVTCGMVAGAVSRSCTAPLDRLKTLMALRDAFRGTQKVKLSSRSAGVVGGLRMIYREGGATAFWRGNFTNVLKVMPELSLKFAIFETLKPRSGDTQNLSNQFCAGAAAGMAGQALVYPLDVIKTRLAASETGVYRHDPKYGGMLGHVVTRMLRYEGWRAMYKGLGISIIGVIPYSGLDLMIFETVKNKYTASVGHPPTWNFLLAAGMVSSIIAQSCTYPLGVVRIRLQAQGMTLDRPILFSGPVDCFRQTYSSHGIRGLYSGFIPSLLKVAPSAAISYTVYEQLKRKIAERRRGEIQML
eukprot:TRINITY_DN20260_c0_g1_i1.p1 TRINITY_DN20260_c0_g1~~TRINITY_DN20260_c0_g1_i1.p1  ORF type:complete len:318 (+),score=10.79 TRINITY_DN20260_c0_g1_i1:32-985(+)